MDANMISHILLWIGLIALALVVVALVRQIGVLHARIAPAGALILDKGVEVNNPAPQVTSADRHGRPVNVGYKGERGQLLFFLSPTCPVCKSLLPTLRSLGKSYRQELEVIYVSDGDHEQQMELIKQHHLEDARYVIGPEIGMTYQIGKLPYAVLIDAEGVLKAKGLVNNREHLESLFEAQAMGVGTLQEYMRQQTAATQ
ncbi:methylamine dehydrogenase accessory protein MauD [Halomonas marinisediminis]|uniref:Methylamine utilization protein MauD n=3 Tax=Halomonadaceae TaxID=28256 RepID=A0A7X5AKL5_9GAMM|nr:methylamine dehydrogenase accessory protein MauD [Halomonas icarae]TDB04674.1 methylamine dehydrogenase accessory protein MauD [Halomonas marinisediminis]